MVDDTLCKSPLSERECVHACVTKWVYPYVFVNVSTMGSYKMGCHKQSVIIMITIIITTQLQTLWRKKGCINYCADQLYTCWPSAQTGHIWSTCPQSFCCGLPFSVSIACVSTGYRSCWHPCEQTAWPSCWGGQSFLTCGQLKWWSFWKKTDRKCRCINHLQKDLAQAQNYLF